MSGDDPAARAIAVYCRVDCNNTEDGNCMREHCPLRAFSPLPLSEREPSDVSGGAQIRLRYWQELERLRGQ